MSRLKIAFAVLVALFVTLGLGYAWGSSGKLSLTSALDETKQQLDIAEARGHLLDARVSLYNVNFGDASRQFEEAKAPLRRVHDLPLPPNANGREGREFLASIWAEFANKDWVPPFVRDAVHRVMRLRSLVEQIGQATVAVGGHAAPLYAE